MTDYLKPKDDFNLPAHAIRAVMNHINRARNHIHDAARAAPDTVQPQLIGTWCEALTLLVDQAASVVRDLEAAYNA